MDRALHGLRHHSSPLIDKRRRCLQKFPARTVSDRAQYRLETKAFLSGTAGFPIGLNGEAEKIEMKL